MEWRTICEAWLDKLGCGMSSKTQYLDVRGTLRVVLVEQNFHNSEGDRIGARENAVGGSGRTAELRSRKARLQGALLPRFTLPHRS